MSLHMRSFSRFFLAFSTTILILMLVACSGSRRVRDGGTDGDADTDIDVDSDVDSDADSDADSDVDSDADSDGDSDSDSDVFEDTDPDLDIDLDSLIQDVSWRLHDTIHSLIYVSWTQTAPATVSIRFTSTGDDWESSPEWDLDAGEQEELILGVPYESDFSFRIMANTVEGDVLTEPITGRTGDFPENFPVPSLNEFQPESVNEEDRYLLGSISAGRGGWAPRGDYYAVIVDREARVLWTRLTPRQHNTIYVRVSYDGNDILIDDATWWSDWDRGRGSRVHRIKIDDSVVETYSTPGLHHAFTETSDGTIVWGSDVDDEELRVLPPGEKWYTLWNCRDFYREIDHRGNCQSNALFWHEEGNTFLYSFYTGSFVIEVDGETGVTLRHWGRTIPEGWRFAPDTPYFAWQHGVSYTDDGHLMVSSHQDEFNNTGVVREYELDEADQLLVEHWSWGEGNGTRADTAGEAHRLTNGNTLINYGSSPKVREVTDDGLIVWEMEWEPPRMVGRTVFFSDLYSFYPERE